MSVHEIYSAWKNLGFWNQSAFMLTFLGFISGVLSLAGVHMELISISFFLLICAVLLFAKGNIVQSNELTKKRNELRCAEERASQDITSVYAQKNEEIRRLELDLATWKDQSAKWQDKLSICQADLKEYKDDCEFLLDDRNELEHKIQRLQERLQEIYEKQPDLDPTRKIAITADMILRPSTQHDVRLGRIHRKIRGIKS